MKNKKTPETDDTGVPSLGKVLDFMRLLWATHHEMQSISKRMGRSLGITGPQRLVIRMLGRFPDVPAKRLAELLHLHPSTLTGVLKRLEKNGYISRKTDPVDARAVVLRLTSKGRSLDVARGGTVEEAVSKALSRLSPGRISAAQEALEAIAAQMDGSAMKSAKGPRKARRKK